MFHRTWAVVLAATATLFSSPSAIAEPDEYLVFVTSVDFPIHLWQAEPGPGEQVVIQEFHSPYDARQYWYWDLSEGTFRNEASGQCLTADRMAVRHLPCRAGADNQRWEQLPVDDSNMLPALFASAAYRDACVTHTGQDQRLVLNPCDTDRSDQQWNVYLERVPSAD